MSSSKAARMRGGTSCRVTGRRSTRRVSSPSLVRATSGGPS
jgi:hypothetical protein